MTVPLRILTLLLSLLVTGTLSVSAHARVRPETRVGGSPDFSSVFGSPSASQVAEPHQENPGCGYDFAPALHKYLYAHGNPVNNSDPSGQAVYFVKRALGIEQGARAWAAGAGHGFLLFTDPTDEGKTDPFTTGQRILATYSWHPNVWDYRKSQGDERGVPGRVWESHPGDLHPPSRMYTPLLVTANPGQQAAVFNYVQSWIESAPIGYELGSPKQDPEHLSNEVGSEQSLPARAAGVYYSLREQNCVWWATVMILQSGAKVNQSILSDIAAFNHGEGAASDVIAGRRNASDVRTLSSIPFGRFTIQPALKIDMLQIGIAP